MRELHVIALSEDGRSLLLATSKEAARGGFRLALDERLAAAVRGDVPRVGEQAVRDSALTPKEIQSRLRAGESPAEIAREAGVAVARVERFSGPVLSERAKVIDAARSAYVVRGRLGRSVLPLGAAVTAALESSSGYRPDSEAWTTRRHDDGRWEVSVSWYARARTRTESWTWNPTTKEVLPVEASAAVLGHTEVPAPSRRSARAAAENDGSTPSAAARPTPTAARKAPATAPAGKAAATKTAPAKAAVSATAGPRKTVPKAVVVKPVDKGAAAKAAVVKPAAKGRAGAVKPMAKVAAGKKAAVKPAGTKAASKAAGPSTGRRLRVVPDQEVRMARRTSPARATVPGWADVLLGATPTAPRPQGKR